MELMDKNEQNKIGEIGINLSCEDYPLQKSTNGLTGIELFLKWFKNFYLL